MSMEIEELLGWGDAEEMEDIEVAPMAIDGENTVLQPNLVTRQAKDALALRSDTAMAAEVTSLRYSGFAG